jgi:large subunit ribosomal protein L22
LRLFFITDLKETFGVLKKMVDAKAVLRFVRVTPRKARLVVDLIRGKGVDEALTILRFVPNHASGLVEKLLRSAVANAEQKKVGDVDDLWVSKAFVDQGTTLKRIRPRSMGRANSIFKRTSHITLVVSPKSKIKDSVSRGS